MDIDQNQLKIWTDGNWEAKRYDYKLHHDDLVIDLGAYAGEWAEKMNDLYDVRVICVEPTSSIMRLNGKWWANIINKAAWIEDGDRIFGGAFYYTSANEPGTMVYPCFDILKILDSHVALLKMNVEGDEYELMARILESGRQAEIKNFQIQFHQVAYYQKYYRLISQKLQETHTKTWGVDFVWENWQIK